MKINVEVNCRLRKTIEVPNDLRVEDVRKYLSGAMNLAGHPQNPACLSPEAGDAISDRLQALVPSLDGWEHTDIDDESWEEVIECNLDHEAMQRDADQTFGERTAPLVCPECDTEFR
jgi:hypothetical protein